MWAHYADSHRGVCLAFSTRSAPFSEAIDVRYRDDYPEVRCAEGDPDQLGAKMLFTKPRAWQYENEWRLIEGDIGYHQFDLDCLEMVICGHGMPRDVQFKIEG